MLLNKGSEHTEAGEPSMSGATITRKHLLLCSPVSPLQHSPCSKSWHKDFFPSRAHPTHLDTLAVRFVQSFITFSLPKSSQVCPRWSLHEDPHMATQCKPPLPRPSYLNQVPCFNSTSYNVKLITCWGCSLLGYSPWHQASPVLSRAANTCPRRCSLNAHEWIKVY